ncbi:glycine cleavage system protein GcvH [Candidatus Bathyarchaeota archaeon]|nr:glycine cleavage system protein GcvH [Candidatus Bathyarchaeota archaeon]
MVKVGEYEVPEGLYFSVDYAWIKVEGEKVRMGITDYAQKQLREIVYAELPEEGTEINQNDPYGTLESVKAVSDLISALSGTIEEVNEEIKSNPELLNEDPYGSGWLIVIRPSNLDEEIKDLMNFEKAVEWHKNQD